MIVFVLKSRHLYTTQEYDTWFNKQTEKAKAQITERLSKIEEEGYFGEYKKLQNSIYELRWKNGRRIYYAFIIDLDVLILLGGNKNGQEEDITRAKKIFKKYIEQ